ncbi:MAG: rhomboid family intramembrane serine protease [Nitrososphaeria archaeon]
MVEWIAEFCPGIRTSLALKKGNLLGPVTYMFVHVSFSHLWDNILGIVLCVIILFFLLLYNDVLEPKYVIACFSITPFISSILSAIIFVIIFPNLTSFGASGVCYAMFGVIFYLLMYSAMLYYEQFVKFKHLNGIEKERKEARNLFIANTILFTSIFLLIIVVPSYVFGAGQFDGYIINVLGHASSFITSYLISLTYFWRKTYNTFGPEFKSIKSKLWPIFYLFHDAGKLIIISFSIIIAIIYPILFLLPNMEKIGYTFIFLPAVTVSLFCLIKKWSKEEFCRCLKLFWLTGIFYMIATMFLIAERDLQPLTSLAYPISFIVILIVFTLILKSGLYLKFLGITDDQIILSNTSILVLVVALVVLETENFDVDLIGISGALIMILIFNYLFGSRRRSEIAKFLSKIGNFRDSYEFIEVALEKVNGGKETSAFLKYRFNEFFNYIERGEFGYAYVTLATGILEMENIKVWDDKKDKKSKGWDFTHEDIRAAIVHATPKRRPKSEEEIGEDLKFKRETLALFKKDPFTPIEDLLEAFIKKYQLSAKTLK